MQVRGHERFVGEIEGWRLDDAGDHVAAPREVVLVVRALRGAVGHDKRRLPRPAGAASALGIVCRRRRHVA
jgi:hypothetical protein